jgi:hypothetical protein
MTDPALLDVAGGQSVALLGYNVVAIKCKRAGDATIKFTTGFRPMCILPALDGATLALHTDSETVDEQTVTTTDSTKLDISNATVGAVYFVIGQN